jgi:hypothetical protein
MQEKKCTNFFLTNGTGYFEITNLASQKTMGGKYF